MVRRRYDRHLRDYVEAEAASSSDLGSLLAQHLKLAGGTMTGKILLDGDPTADLHPVTRQFLFANLSAGGAQTYVDTVELSAVDTSIGMSGLDLAADQEYILRCALASNTGSTVNVSLFLGGDTAPGNYRRETQNRFTVGGGSNHGYISELRGGDDTVTWIWITQDPTGYPRSVALVNSGSITNIHGMRFVHVWKDLTNVDEFALTGDVASCFAAGTKVDVFRRKTT